MNSSRRYGIQVWFFVVLILAGDCSLVWAVTCDQCLPGTECDCHGCPYDVDGECITNPLFFGYYQTNWRKWPGDLGTQTDAASPVPNSVSEGELPEPLREEESYLRPEESHEPRVPPADVSRQPDVITDSAAEARPEEDLDLRVDPFKDDPFPLGQPETVPTAPPLVPEDTTPTAPLLVPEDTTPTVPLLVPEDTTPTVPLLVPKDTTPTVPSLVPEDTPTAPLQPENESLPPFAPEADEDDLNLDEIFDQQSSNLRGRRLRSRNRTVTSRTLRSHEVRPAVAVRDVVVGENRVHRASAGQRTAPVSRRDADFRNPLRRTKSRALQSAVANRGGKSRVNPFRVD